MTYDTDHARFRDDIGTYLAGGLTADERRALEAHAADCPDCAAALHESRAQEEDLNEMFAAVRPAEDFEDRLVTRLRDEAAAQRARLRIPAVHPAIRRAPVAGAAAVTPRGFGYVATQAV